MAELEPVLDLPLPIPLDDVVPVGVAFDAPEQTAPVWT